MPRTRSIRRTPKKSSKRSAAKKKPSILLRFLPENLQAFIARRLVDFFALSFVLGGLFITLALLSYQSQDPSWNSATSTAKQTANNWMGLSGAWSADLLLQTIGLGALAFGAIFIIWGVRSFNRQALRPLALRFIALVISAISLSIACAQIPSGEWLTHPYLGSSTGTLILSALGKIGQGISPWFSPLAITLIAGLLAIVSGLYAAAVQKAEIYSIIARTGFFIWACFTYIANLVTGFKAWIAHHNDPDYRPNLMHAFKAFPKFKPAPKATQEAPAGTSPTIAEPLQPAETLQSTAPIQSQNAQAQNIPVVTAASTPDKLKPAQRTFSLDGEDWELPSLTLLETAPEQQQVTFLNKEALRKNAELLKNVLADFNIQGEITSIHPGPVVTLYELEPAPGTKSSKVIGLADDIARSMSVISVRAAVVPGRNVIGIELPNATRQIVYMQELLASSVFEKTSAKLPLVLGKDIAGQPIIADLAKMPHLLVAGTTGSGKSVAVNTMILSLLYRLSPEQCRFIMIDPKMLELSVYDGIPHLLSPVVTEPGKAVVALKWTVHEMEERYRAMSKLGVRNIAGYNTRICEARDKGETLMKKVQTGFDPATGAGTYEEQPIDLVELPYIVVIVDEFADLMLVAGKDVESAIQRLAQMARAAGIHLIMATQRPSVDVITGVIKANFPTRISFQVTSKVDSRTILGEGGAEQLLGMGDMLHMEPGGRVKRVHGPFVSDTDVEKIVKDLKSKAEPTYIQGLTDEGDFGDSDVMAAMFGDGESEGEKVDELYDQAVALIAREGKASTSFVQRYLQIGYNRAARIIEEMERQGIISPANATGKREILIHDFSDV